MPVDHYPQKTEAQLLTLLDALQKRQTTGLTVQSSAVGMQTVKTLSGGNRVDVELRRVLYSLSLRNPDLYPDPYAGRVRRTQAYYT